MSAFKSHSCWIPRASILLNGTGLIALDSRAKGNTAAPCLSPSVACTIRFSGGGL